MWEESGRRGARGEGLEEGRRGGGQEGSRGCPSLCHPRSGVSSRHGQSGMKGPRVHNPGCLGETCSPSFSRARSLSPKWNVGRSTPKLTTKSWKAPPSNSADSRSRGRQPNGPRPSILSPSPLPLYLKLTTSSRKATTPVGANAAKTASALPDLANRPAKTGPSPDNTMHLTVPASLIQATKALYQEIPGLLVSRQPNEALLGQGNTTWPDTGVVPRFLSGCLGSLGEKLVSTTLRCQVGGG